MLPGNLFSTLQDHSCPVEFLRRVRTSPECPPQHLWHWAQLLGAPAVKNREILHQKLLKWDLVKAQTDPWPSLHHLGQTTSLGFGFLGFCFSFVFFCLFRSKVSWDSVQFLSLWCKRGLLWVVASVNDITAHAHTQLELAGCTQNLDPARDAQICENAQKFHEPAVHSSGFSSLVTTAVTKTQQSVEIVAAPCHEHQQRCAEKYRILNLRVGRDQFTFLGYQKASFFGRDLFSGETSIVFNRPGVTQGWVSSDCCWDYKLEWAKPLLFLQNFPFEMTVIKTYPCRSDVIP